MKRYSILISLLISGILLFVCFSCSEKSNIDDSLKVKTKEVSIWSAYSFTFTAIVSSEVQVSDNRNVQVGIFVGTAPGVNYQNRLFSTDFIQYKSGTLEYSNGVINFVGGDFILTPGSKAYYRAYLFVTEDGKQPYFIYGEELSFDVPRE